MWSVAEPEFERLVKEFYMPLYRFGLSLTRSESDAGDLAQQTFYTWARKGHQLRDSAKAKTWLFTTLYRDFLGRRRHGKRFVDLELEPELIEPLQVAPQVVESIDAAIVQEALKTLEERYCAPITLYYMKQHSYREIAEILGIPIGTVMSRLSRGKSELRALLSDFSQREERKIVPLPAAESHG